MKNLEEDRRNIAHGPFILAFRRLHGGLDDAIGDHRGVRQHALLSASVHHFGTAVRHFDDLVCVFGFIIVGLADADIGSEANYRRLRGWWDKC